MKTHTAGITFDQINKAIRKEDTSIAKKRKSNIWENSRHSLIKMKTHSILTKSYKVTIIGSLVVIKYINE